jgi:SAM-dependent methyltransferase
MLRRSCPRAGYLPPTLAPAAARRDRGAGGTVPVAAGRATARTLRSAHRPQLGPGNRRRQRHRRRPARPTGRERIGEIGFGPGRTLARLAAAGADVLGVDASADMVAVAVRRNAAHINAGRIRLHHGDGTLPAGDGTLDGVLSVHSLYFWPDPAVVLAEIRRALRPADGSSSPSARASTRDPPGFDPTVYRLPATTEAVDWLNDAGFTNMAVHRRPRTATIVWITRPRRDHRGPSTMDRSRGFCGPRIVDGTKPTSTRRTLRCRLSLTANACICPRSKRRWS